MPTRPCSCLECEALDAIPERPYVAKVREYLRTRKPRYTEQSCKEALRWIANYGTIQCCPAVDPEDRDAVEALLPEAPIGDWIRHEAYVWATDECGLAENCGCESCLHEVANLEAMGAALA